MARGRGPAHDPEAPRPAGSRPRAGHPKDAGSGDPHAGDLQPPPGRHSSGCAPPFAPVSFPCPAGAAAFATPRESSGNSTGRRPGNEGPRRRRPQPRQGAEGWNRAAAGGSARGRRAEGERKGTSKVRSRRPRRGWPAAPTFPLGPGSALRLRCRWSGEQGAAPLTPVIPRPVRGIPPAAWPASGLEAYRHDAAGAPQLGC